MENNYTEAFKNTILENYPIYLKKIILSQFVYSGYIINNKKNSEQLTLNITDSPDVTEYDTPDDKIKCILNQSNDMLCYFEDFEYQKEYRHICFFEFSELSSEVIEALVKNNEFNIYDIRVKNKHYDEFSKPTIHIAGNIIFLKFSKLLRNEQSSIKYTILCLIDKDNKVLEIRFDRIGIEYKKSFNFYKDQINWILKYLKQNLKMEINYIDFKAVVEYIKTEKDEATIYAQRMNRNGSTAYLEAYDDEEMIMPILGELSKFIEDNKSLFEIDENTKKIKKGLENFVQEIEIKSDLPVVKLKIDSKNIKLGITHDYKESGFSLFMLYGDLTGSSGRMDYVREFLISSYKQLKKEVQSDTVSTEEN